MFLDLKEMRGTRDRVDRTYPPAVFEAEADVFRVVEPVRLAFDVLKDQRRVRLLGRVATGLEVACSRCLEMFHLPVDAAFDLMYVPQQENAGDGEIEVEDDDLSTAFYRDEMIDLGAMMREQFLLALPMKPLCGEDCRGLCPVCGTNWNTGACTCSRQWTDPRLEGLRAFSTGDENRKPRH